MQSAAGTRALATLTALWLVVAATGLQAVTRPVPTAPELSAEAYLLLDFHSGQVLGEKNADVRVKPASLTKIMTAYVVLREIAAGHIHLDEEVTVSQKAWRTPGSRTFIEIGNRLTVGQLLKGMIVQSGNDASVALAEFVAGTEDTFAQMMNTEARRLGMANTHFANSTGLPHDDMYTTARDLALLTATLIREFPEQYKWHAIKQYTYNDITQYNRNKLLWRDESVDGVKTGHTENAGYCLVASALRNDARLISVIMNTRSVSIRTEESQALLNYGFRFFESHRLYAGGDALTVARIWKGSDSNLPIGVDEDLYITIPRNRYDELRADMTLPARIDAPIRKGEPLGVVRIRLSDEALVERPAVALEDVPEGPVWKRLADEALLLFQ